MDETDQAIENFIYLVLQLKSEVSAQSVVAKRKGERSFMAYENIQ